MEFVPFAFCNSVVAVLGDLSLIEEPVSSRVWQKAITQQTQNRISATIVIAYEDGIWSYGIKYVLGKFHYLTFEDLQKMNGKYFRIDHIHVERSPQPNQSSFEGILKLVKFTVPFVSMCELQIQDVDRFQEDELCQLLSFYRNSSINSLRTSGKLDPICVSLREILKLDMLKEVRLLCADVPSTFVEEIEEIALTKLFERFIFSPKTFKFTRSFFEKLFARSFDGSFGTCRFQSCFDFKVGNLKDFREDLQISASDWLIEWRRVDGVFVTVENNVWDNRLYVEFALARTHRFF